MNGIREGGTKMNNYKYFDNVKKNGYFTESPCQFCGTTKNCLDGVFFESSDDISSICLECFDKKKIHVSIPEYIKNRIKNNRDQKVNELQFCPPVPWIQNNDWPVCCDDFMVFIGEWEQEEFCSHSTDGDGLSLLKELLADELKNIVESYDALWADLGYETAAFVFMCPNCGKKVVICQDY